MRKEHIENLVIDLRDNGGGNGNIGANLVSYIIDSTLTYYLDKKMTPFRYKDYLTQKEGMIVSNKYVMADSITRNYYFKVKPNRKCNFNWAGICPHQWRYFFDWSIRGFRVEKCRGGYHGGSGDRRQRVCHRRRSDCHARASI